MSCNCGKGCWKPETRHERPVHMLFKGEMGLQPENCPHGRRSKSCFGYDDWVYWGFACNQEEVTADWAADNSDNTIKEDFFESEIWISTGGLRESFHLQLKHTEPEAICLVVLV